MTMNHTLQLEIDWSKVRCVIFDVDGTLYDQRKLRKLMAWKLVQFYAMQPWQIGDVNVLQHFRRERELHAGDTLGKLEKRQYEWAAGAAGVSIERVRRIVEKWIFKLPLKYLPKCRFTGIVEFFDSLAGHGIVRAIFSDYPAADKMAALGLSASWMAASTDPQIDRFKPSPKGLLVIAERLGLPVPQCVFIGDRDDRDGECARNAGMPYLILERFHSGKKNRFQTYQQLHNRLCQGYA